jgi:hypothetical protein
MPSNFSKIKIALQTILAGLQNQMLLNKLALAQERKIKDRTRRGVDLEGKTFKPYNPQYAKRKFKITGIPTHVVNLTFDDISGMMQQIDHVIANDFSKVEIQILDPQKRKIAGYHHETGAGRSRVIRRFWGINQQDENDLLRIIGRDLELLVQKLGE